MQLVIAFDIYRDFVFWTRTQYIFFRNSGFLPSPCTNASRIFCCHIKTFMDALILSHPHMHAQSHTHTCTHTHTHTHSNRPPCTVSSSLISLARCWGVRYSLPSDVYSTSISFSSTSFVTSSTTLRSDNLRTKFHLCASSSKHKYTTLRSYNLILMLVILIAKIYYTTLPSNNLTAKLHLNATASSSKHSYTTLSSDNMRTKLHLCPNSSKHNYPTLCFKLKRSNKLKTTWQQSFISVPTAQNTATQHCAPEDNLTTKLHLCASSLKHNYTTLYSDVTPKHSFISVPAAQNTTTQHCVIIKTTRQQSFISMPAALNTTTQHCVIVKTTWQQSFISMPAALNTTITEPCWLRCPVQFVSEKSYHKC